MDTSAYCISAHPLETVTCEHGRIDRHPVTGPGLPESATALIATDRHDPRYLAGTTGTTGSDVIIREVVDRALRDGTLPG
jgi:hypothetical protein